MATLPLLEGTGKAFDFCEDRQLFSQYQALCTQLVPTLSLRDMGIVPHVYRSETDPGGIYSNILRAMTS